MAELTDIAAPIPLLSHAIHIHGASVQIAAHGKEGEAGAESDQDWRAGRDAHETLAVLPSVETTANKALGTSLLLDQLASNDAAEIESAIAQCITMAQTASESAVFAPHELLEVLLALEFVDTEAFPAAAEAVRLLKTVLARFSDTEDDRSIPSPASSPDSTAQTPSPPPIPGPDAFSLLATNAVPDITSTDGIIADTSPAIVRLQRSLALLADMHMKTSSTVLTTVPLGSSNGSGIPVAAAVDPALSACYISHDRVNACALYAANRKPGAFLLPTGAAAQRQRSPLDPPVRTDTSTAPQHLVCTTGSPAFVLARRHRDTPGIIRVLDPDSLETCAVFEQRPHEAEPAPAQETGTGDRGAKGVHKRKRQRRQQAELDVGFERLLGENLVALIPAQGHSFACIDKVAQGYVLRCFDMVDPNTPTPTAATAATSSTNASTTMNAGQRNAALEPRAFRVASSTPLALRQSIMLQLSLVHGNTEQAHGVPWPRAVATILPNSRRRGAGRRSVTWSDIDDVDAKDSKDSTLSREVLLLKEDGALCTTDGKPAREVSPAHRVKGVAETMEDNALIVHTDHGVQEVCHSGSTDLLRGYAAPEDLAQVAVFGANKTLLGVTQSGGIVLRGARACRGLWSPTVPVVIEDDSVDSLTCRPWRRLRLRMHGSAAVHVVEMHITETHATVLVAVPAAHAATAKQHLSLVGGAVVEAGIEQPHQVHARHSSPALKELDGESGKGRIGGCDGRGGSGTGKAKGTGQHGRDADDIVTLVLNAQLVPPEELASTSSSSSALSSSLSDASGRGSVQHALALSTKEDVVELFSPMVVRVRDMHTEPPAPHSEWRHVSRHTERSGPIAMRTGSDDGAVYECFSWSWLITDEGDITFGVERPSDYLFKSPTMTFAKRPAASSRFCHPLECCIVTARLVRMRDECYFEVLVMPPPPSVLDVEGYSGQRNVCSVTSSFRQRFSDKLENKKRLYVQLGSDARAKPVPCPIRPESPLFLKANTRDAPVEVQLHKERAVQVVGGSRHALVVTSSGGLYSVGCNAFGQCGRSLAYRGMQLRRGICDREDHQVYPEEMKHTCSSCGRWGADIAVETSKGCALTPGLQRSKVSAAACVRCYRCADCVDKKRLLTDTQLESIDVDVALARVAVPFERCVQAAAGRFHSVVLAEDGTAYTCGLNNGNQLGRELKHENRAGDFGQHCDCLPHASDAFAAVPLPDAASTSAVLRVDAGDDLTLLLTASGHAVVFGGFLPSKCVDLQAALGVPVSLTNTRPGQRTETAGDTPVQVFLGGGKRLLAFGHTEALQVKQGQHRVVAGVFEDYTCLLRQPQPQQKPSTWELIRVFHGDLEPFQDPTGHTLVFEDFEPVGFVPGLPVLFGWERPQHSASATGLQFRLLHTPSRVGQELLQVRKHHPRLTSLAKTLTGVVHNPFFNSMQGAPLRQRLAGPLQRVACLAAYASGAVLRRKAQVLEDMPVRTGVNATRFQHCTITLVLKQPCMVEFALLHGATLISDTGSSRTRWFVPANTPGTFTVDYTPPTKRESNKRFVVDCGGTVPDVVQRLQCSTRYVRGLASIAFTRITPLEQAFLGLEGCHSMSPSRVTLGTYRATDTLHKHLHQLTAIGAAAMTPYDHVAGAVTTQVLLSDVAVHLLLSQSQSSSDQPDLGHLLSECSMLLANLQAAAAGRDMQQWQHAFEQLMDLVIARTPSNTLLKQALMKLSQLDECDAFTTPQTAEAAVVAHTLNRCWKDVVAEELFAVLGIEDLSSSDAAETLLQFFESLFAFTKKTGGASQRQFFQLIRSCLQAVMRWVSDHPDQTGIAGFLTDMLQVFHSELKQQGVLTQQPQPQAQPQPQGQGQGGPLLLSTLSSLLLVCSTWFGQQTKGSPSLALERLLKTLLCLYTDVSEGNRGTMEHDPATAARQRDELLELGSFGHVCTVESDHPYTSGRVDTKRVTFKEPCLVAIGFHTNCALASNEDRLVISADSSSAKSVTITGGQPFPDAFQVMATSAVQFRLETCTRDKKAEGDSDDDSFGYRCQVVAFPIETLTRTVTSPTKESIETQLADATIKLCKRVLGDVMADKDETQVAHVPLSFNPTFHGNAVEIEDRATAMKEGRVPGQVAHRPGGHNRACCFSLFPIAEQGGKKEFAVEVDKIDSTKAGSMAMGFVVMPKFEDEEDKAPLNRLFKTIPSSAILISEKSLIYVANTEAYKGNSNLGTVSKDSNYLHLNNVQIGEKIKMWMTKDRDVFIQGPRQKEPAKIPLAGSVDYTQDVYAFVDVYGRTQKVTMSGTSEVRLAPDPAYPRTAPCPFCKAAMIMSRGYAEVECEYGQPLPYGSRYMLCPKCLTTSSLDGAFAIHRKLNARVVEQLVPVINVAFEKKAPGVFGLNKTFDRGTVTWEVQLLSDEPTCLGVRLPTERPTKKPLGVFVDCKAQELQYNGTKLMPWPAVEHKPRSFMFVLDCSSCVLTVAERNGATRTLQVPPGCQACVYSSNTALALDDHVRMATLAWSFGEPVSEHLTSLPKSKLVSQPLGAMNICTAQDASEEETNTQYSQFAADFLDMTSHTQGGALADVLQRSLQTGAWFDVHVSRHSSVEAPLTILATSEDADKTAAAATMCGVEDFAGPSSVSSSSESLAVLEPTSSSPQHEPEAAAVPITAEQWRAARAIMFSYWWHHDQADDVLEASKFLPLQEAQPYRQEEWYARHYNEAEILSASAECNTSCLVRLFSNTMQARLLAHAQPPPSHHGLAVEVLLPHTSAHGAVLVHDPTSDASVVVPGRLAHEEDRPAAVVVDTPVLDTDNNIVRVETLTPLRVFPVGTAAASGVDVTFACVPSAGRVGWAEYLALTQQSPLMPWLLNTNDTTLTTTVATAATAAQRELVSLEVFVGLELSSFTCLVPRDMVRRLPHAAAADTQPLHRLVGDAAFVLGHVQLLQLAAGKASKTNLLVDVARELLRFEPAMASHSLNALMHPLVPQDHSALQTIEEAGEAMGETGAGPGTQPGLLTRSHSEGPGSPSRQPAPARRLSSAEAPLHAQTPAPGTTAGAGIAESVKDIQGFVDEMQVLLSRVREKHKAEDWQRVFEATQESVSPWTSISVLNFLAQTTTRVDVLASVLSAFTGLFATRTTATTYYEDEEGEGAQKRADEEEDEEEELEDGEGRGNKGAGKQKKQLKKKKKKKKKKGANDEKKEKNGNGGKRDGKKKEEGEAKDKKGGKGRNGKNDKGKGEGKDKDDKAKGRTVAEDQDEEDKAKTKKRKLNLLEESVNAIHTLDLGHGLELRASRIALIKFLDTVARLGTWLPPAHPLQRLSIRCWALPQIAEREPHLLQATHVLSWLSRLLLMEQRSSASAAATPHRSGARRRRITEMADAHESQQRDADRSKKGQEQGSEGDQGEAKGKEAKKEEGATSMAQDAKGTKGGKAKPSSPAPATSTPSSPSPASSSSPSRGETKTAAPSTSKQQSKVALSPGPTGVALPPEAGQDPMLRGEDEVDITAHVTLAVSSQPDMAGSLVDGRTDTMWQGRAAGSSSWIKVSYDTAAVEKEVGGPLGPPSTVYVHFDPTRDNMDKMPTSIELQDLSSSGVEAPEVVSATFAPRRPTWFALKCPQHAATAATAATAHAAAHNEGSDSNGNGSSSSSSSGGSHGQQQSSRGKVELKLVLKTRREVRVRQVRVCCAGTRRPLFNEAGLGHPVHCDALSLFKLLSAGLLKADAPALIGRGAIADDDLLGLLNRGDGVLQAGPLQTQMLKHIVRGLGLETAAVVEVCCSTTAEHGAADTEGMQEEAEERESRDEYILELLDLLRDALARSSAAAPSTAVLKLLYQQLHCGSARVQVAAVSLLRVIAPRQRCSALSSVEVTSFAGTSVAVPHVHMLLSAVAKIIQVQLRLRVAEGGTMSSTTHQVSLKQLCGIEDAPSTQQQQQQQQQVGGPGLSRQTPVDAGNSKTATATTTSTTETQETEAHLLAAAQNIKQQVSSWQVAGDCMGSFKEIVSLFSFLQRSATWQTDIREELASLLLELNRRGRQVEGDVASMFSFFGEYTTWLAAAALAIMTKHSVDGINKTIRRLEGNTFLCDHHDDGVTAASVFCNSCHAHFCSFCDTFAHLHPSKRHHERKDVDQMETLSVEWNDGYARIKQPSFLVLVDPKNLRSIVEFRSTKKSSDGSTRQCRFCLLPVEGADDKPPGEVVCGSTECTDAFERVCRRTLPCGHPCQGVKGEAKCLPCLQCGKAAGLTQQDADDECMVCFCGGLREEPCIMLVCGHIFHSECIFRMLKAGWPGPRITFDFATCPLCRVSLLKGDAHPLLADVLAPIIALHADVKRKALMRLQYDNEKVEGAEEQRAARAMKKYTYYKCHRCSKAYFGGEEECAVGSNEFDESELVCPACSGGEAQQICPKHGTDFLEYKCRYCCSVAVFFCFGTTHFCQPCHDHYQRCLDCPKEELPHCPAGSKLTQLEGDECPLHVKHPPTGEEFALGCGICRNAQTF